MHLQQIVPRAVESAKRNTSSLGTGVLLCTGLQATARRNMLNEGKEFSRSTTLIRGSSQWQYLLHLYNQ